MSSNIRISKTCEYCGKEYIAQTTITRYCSHNCNRKDYKKRKRSEKIEKIHKPDIVQNKNDIKEQDYLNISEACCVMKISRRTLYRLISKNKLKIIKVGSRTIIRKKDIKLFFNYSIIQL